MTLEQLAALPAGTKVRVWIDQYKIQDETTDVYDYGVIQQAGVVTHIKFKVAWQDDELVVLIDTKDKVWEDFVKDMDEDPA